MPYTALEVALRSILVTASTAASTRIYPVYLPQDVTLPAITYQLLDDDPKDNAAGCAGLFMARVQFDVFAETFLAMKSLVDEVRNALMGYTGVVSDVTIKGIRLETKLDMFEPEIKNHRGIIRFHVWHSEANPS